MGAIELKKLSNTQVSEYGSINAESIINFLRQVRQKYLSTSKTHLMLDKSGYHRAKEVKKVLKS